MLQARRYPQILAAVGAGAFGMAYVAHFGFGLEPCILCLYRLVPYVGTALLALLVLKISTNSPLMPVIIALCAVIYLSGAGIAIYHVGVQELWWEGPAMCGGVQSGAGSLAELKAQLLAQPIIRCDKIDWTLFGITMPTVNVFFSAALTVFCLIAPSRWMKK